MEVGTHFGMHQNGLRSFAVEVRRLPDPALETFIENCAGQRMPRYFQANCGKYLLSLYLGFLQYRMLSFRSESFMSQWRISSMYVVRALAVALESESSGCRFSPQIHGFSSL
jgi:hypothetical protein